MNKMLPLLILLSLLTSCRYFVGDEVLRITVEEITYESLNHPAEGIRTFEKGDELHFWTDMDVEYTGNVGLTCMVRILLNGEMDEEIILNPFEGDLTLDNDKAQAADHIRWDREARQLIMNVQETGEYHFIVFLLASSNPTLKVHEFDFVVRM